MKDLCARYPVVEMPGDAKHLGELATLFLPGERRVNLWVTQGEHPCACSTWVDLVDSGPTPYGSWHESVRIPIDVADMLGRILLSLDPTNLAQFAARLADVVDVCRDEHQCQGMDGEPATHAEPYVLSVPVGEQTVETCMAWVRAVQEVIAPDVESVELAAELLVSGALTETDPGLPLRVELLATEAGVRVEVVRVAMRRGSGETWGKLSRLSTRFGSKGTNTPGHLGHMWIELRRTDRGQR